MTGLSWAGAARAACLAQVVALTSALPARAGETVWRDALELTVEGRGWSDTEQPFDRLPARARELVRPQVWQLARESAGIAVRFVSDAPSLRARWELTSDRLAMQHMPASGVSGLDLYARAADGRWRWAGVGWPQASTTCEAVLVDGLPAGEREYLLYLPLYNGVRSLAIGVPQGSRLAPAPPRPEARRPPLVVYGTSITQGACASRPGACHTALLGRGLEREVINLGFSGQGRLDLELAELLGELDAAAYVLDCLPNLRAEEVARRAAPFVRALRARRPATPIVLVEDRSYGNAWLRSAARERNDTSRAALRAAYEALLAEGVEGLHYLEGAALLGDDDEATVDASHPSDLGFRRQAAAFLETLGPLLR